MAWDEPRRLWTYDFVEGDVEFLTKFAGPRESVP
jgi:hypothetical protein